jgi:hypothetical protein
MLQRPDEKGPPRLRLADAPMAYMPRPRLKRVFGRLIRYATADRHRPCLHFNRYPHKIIGVEFVSGRIATSWVWPVWVIGLPLTRRQLEVEHGELIRDAER